MIKQLFYLAQWFVRARFFGRKCPLQSVIFITEACNLKCRHCALAQNGIATSKHKSFEQIREEMEYSYNLGSRFIDFEGGEPTLWRGTDPETGATMDVNDLIVYAEGRAYPRMESRATGGGRFRKEPLVVLQ